MRLSLFSIALLLLAAGSDAKPLKKGKRQCVRRQNNGTSPGVPSALGSVPSSFPVQKGITGPNGAGAAITTPGKKPRNISRGHAADRRSLSAGPGPSKSSSSGGQGSCPGFRNVVFNTGASKNAGWSEKTWGSMVSHGVDDWSMQRFFCPSTSILLIAVSSRLLPFTAGQERNLQRPQRSSRHNPRPKCPPNPPCDGPRRRPGRSGAHEDQSP